MSSSPQRRHIAATSEDLAAKIDTIGEAPTATIQVTSNTRGPGVPTDLVEQRAESVSRFLKGQGISASMIQAQTVPGNRITGPARIFISYRRAEASWPVRWLSDWLADRYGAGAAFLDADSIRPGDDFAAEIRTAVGACAVLLAVIGPQWLAEESGARRVDDPQDWVRLEIETAIERRIRTIPLLVDGATMPTARELPSSLRLLSGKQALTLNPAAPDTRKLTSVLQSVLM